MLTKEQLEALSTEDVLNVSLNDIKEAEGFKAWPDGMYRARIDEVKIEDMETKNGKKDVLKIVFECIECLEPADPNAQLPDAGSKQTFSYFLPDGVAYFKRDYKALLEDGQYEKVADALEAMPNMEVTMLVTSRADKNDKSKRYSSASEVAPV